MRLFANSLSSYDPIGDNTDVWIIAGQSNAAGRGNTDPLPPYEQPNPNAYLLGSTNPPIVDPFTVIDYSGSFVSGDNHGPEPSIAYRYNNREMYFVKVAAGGTSIENEWFSGAQRTQLINYIQQAKIYFTNNSISNIRWNLYWDQWERDCAIDTAASNYYNLYQNLVNAILSEVGSLNKHIIHKVNPNSSAYTANAQSVINGDLIITAQQNASTFYNADILDTDDLTLFDNLHYDSLGQIEIGNRIYNLI